MQHSMLSFRLRIAVWSLASHPSHLWLPAAFVQLSPPGPDDVVDDLIQPLHSCQVLGSAWQGHPLRDAYAGLVGKPLKGRLDGS